MTDPQDREARLLRTRITYVQQAETQIRELKEGKFKAVQEKLHHLPKAAGAIARPVPGRPGYLAVEMPEPPPPLLLIVYRYTASFKLFRRVWEIAGLVFPSTVDLSSDEPRDAAALLK